MSAPAILALDQGTTSSRAIAFDPAGQPLAVAQIELAQSFPRPGWVEHDPERIWADTLASGREVVRQIGDRGIAAIGITNQRETTLLWDRASGRVLHPAIVWQDRRTAAHCDRLRADGAAPTIAARTGLILDPYFSATKLAWLLDHVDGARERAKRGELVFGTVDTFLLWRLTGGRVHATDATNASRTMLFDIERQRWDPDLLALFDIPASVLPEVRDSSGDFGTTDAALLGHAIPIRGVAGDQQAATFGQAAFEPGMVKGTYGTGCFMLLNTGARIARSTHGLLASVAWRLDGKVTYALEGAIFVAGAAMQWLRDGLGIIGDAAESEMLAASIADTGGVHLVPAFAGLGAPYWDAGARGAITGLTRASGRAEIVRAALEAIAYQSRDLLEAMAADGAPPPRTLRVDGGLARNAWAMQFLADMTGTTVDRPEVTEATARGAAWLAGMAAGVYGSLDEIGRQWRLERRFEPAMPVDRRDFLYDAWRTAVRRVTTPGTDPT